MPDPVTAALVVACFLVGGFVKGAIGMGLPVVVLATLVMVMPLREAMAIFVIPGIASNIWQATSGPWLGALARRLWAFLGAAILAILVGVAIMAGTRSEVMVAVLGGVLCVYSAFSLLAPRLPVPGRHEPWLSPVAGGLGGVMFGMAGIFIVPGLLYLETLRLPRDQFVQALGLSFITISTTLGIAMTGHRLVTLEHAALGVLALAPVFAGIWAGRHIRHLISEEFYRKLFFVALFVTGVYYLARSFALI